MGEAQLSLCRLVNSTEHFTTRVVHTTDSTYLQIMCFKHCSWISYSQLQPIVKQSLSLNFCNEICQGFMGSGVDQKSLAGEGDKTTACQYMYYTCSWHFLMRQYWTLECYKYNSTATYPQANFFFFFSLLDSIFSCTCGNKCIIRITDKDTAYKSVVYISILKIVEIWMIIYLRLLTELFSIYSICYLFSKLQHKKD